eukprot:scaffold7240_cov129-Isochrysis_galbana.AAC.1
MKKKLCNTRVVWTGYHDGAAARDRPDSRARAWLAPRSGPVQTAVTRAHNTGTIARARSSDLLE